VTCEGQFGDVLEFINLHNQTKFRDLGEKQRTLTFQLTTVLFREVVTVAVNGMKRRVGILMMQKAGFDAFLIGEGLLIVALATFSNQ
jgi:indole-3-glycerol phosphate synthase